MRNGMHSGRARRQGAIVVVPVYRLPLLEFEDVTATTTGERYGDSQQGERHSDVEPEEFVRGDGLTRCHQQAGPRAQPKLRWSRDSSQGGRATGEQDT